MAEQLVQIISDYSGIDKGEITADLSLKTAAALNSFQLLSMISEIEDAFQVEIPEYKLMDFSTLGDLQAYLQSAN